MKRLPFPARHRDSQGVALIIVLSMLVLLSGLLVAFLSTARTERAAAASDSATAASRQIADSTVSFVISQIRDATTTPAENTTWASQPGAIRTFGGTLNGQRKLLKDQAYYDGYAASGNDLVFKLYSSDRMRVSGGDYTNVDLPEETGLIESWNRTSPTDGYVDLNEPVLSLRRDLDKNGDVVEPRYPIVDPRAAYSKEGRETAIGGGIVDGFDGKISTDPSFRLAEGGSVPYIPMPVKWLYVLKDGTMGPASLATEDNPIVGRTAFWSDDDSTKLNINTASEGTFWDTPSGSSTQECGVFHYQKGDIPGTAGGMNLAGSQPVKNEFQRYPGHPMTTCLSPALGWVWGVLPTTPVYPYAGTVRNAIYNDYKAAIYQISPFAPYEYGTSQGAMRNTDLEVNSNYALKVMTKHLYTSVDELLFKAARFKPAGEGPEVNAQGKLTPEALEKTRFFLTATSRSPEVNLFGRPRVTIWPVNADYRYRTAADDLFIFTSKVTKALSGNEKKFNLLRGDAKSGKNDFFGTWTNAANDDQNVKMFTYLQDMTSRAVPGFGRSFSDSSKWGAFGRDEILLLAFDYIRTINMTDTGTTNRSLNVFAPYTPRFFTPANGTVVPDDQYVRYARSNDWAGQVTPLRRVVVPTSTTKEDQLQGFGRFIQPTEVSVAFTPLLGVPPGRPPGSKYIQAALIIENSSVMGGFPGIRETYWTKITPLRPAKVKMGAGPIIDINLCGKCYENIDNTPPDPISYLRGLVNIPNVSSHEVAQGRAYMPTLGYLTQFYQFQEHRGFTLMGDAHVNDPNRVTNFTVKPKLLDNSRPENRYRGNIFTTTQTPPVISDGLITPTSYPRSTSFGNNGTVNYYPYVSDPIRCVEPDPDPLKPSGTLRATSQFQIVDLGRYKIEVFVGEGPTDPRSTLGQSRISGEPGDAPLERPVQTLFVSFPGNWTVSSPIPPSGTMAIPADATVSTGTNPQLYDRLNNPGDAGKPFVEFPKDVFKDTDIVRSMELSCVPRNNGANTDSNAGDIRLAAARAIVPEEWWTPVDNVSTFQAANPRLLHRLQRGHGDPDRGFAAGTNQGNFVTGGGMRTNKPPILPRRTNGVKRIDGGPGDWDRGLSKHMDGAMGNKVDEGNLKFDKTTTNYGGMPYFKGRGIEETNQAYFSPNRQISSAVMFGSLPTGIRPDPAQNQPWQTLLFRPNRESGTTHPGADVSQGPPDHLFLDLFNLPVVEPYAISEPLATSGKINLNYVIAPFGYARGESGNNPGTSNPRSYLRRDTGLRGVLKSVYVMGVPNTQSDGGHTEDPNGQSYKFRSPIDLNRTLEAMETRLKAQNDGYPLFRSASEICTVDLYPAEAQFNVGGNWNTYWKDRFALTGDNMRERPYAHIYPRVTTKSNVYTVHMRCQTIRKAKGTPVNEFDPDKDAVLGEYRGSATIERFVDPNDSELLKYDEKRNKLDSYYRYRVINTKQFSSR